MPTQLHAEDEHDNGVQGKQRGTLSECKSTSEAHRSNQNLNLIKIPHQPQNNQQNIHSLQKLHSMNAIGIPMHAYHDKGKTGKEVDATYWTGGKDGCKSTLTKLRNTHVCVVDNSTSRHAKCQQLKKARSSYVFTYPFPHLSTVDGFIAINYKGKVLGIIMYTFLPSIIYKRLVAWPFKLAFLFRS